MTPTEELLANAQQSVENALQEELADLPRQNLAEFKPRVRGTSVAEQMLAIADTIRGVHQELDRLEAEFSGRINAIRKTLGGKA